VLGILTADCVPVLFADPAAGVIGAAHAGWKGAKDGVVARTVDAMTGLGARRERIVAAVGPHIGFRSYEVGPEFPARFLAEDPAHARLFRPAGRAGHHLFDLGGYVDHCLARAGVGAVHHGPWDTLAEADRFFSYRRATLAGEPDYGRGLSAIVLG
jgi:YfiH family protein